MDQEAIKVRPLPKSSFSNGNPDVRVDMNTGQVGRHVDRDSSKISMLVSDGLERQGDPFNAQRTQSENRVTELSCFREVERRPGLA